MDASSPRNAKGAISDPVLTPVTMSNCGLANGSSAGTSPQPLRKPAPKAPQSPPPERISTSMAGGPGVRLALKSSYRDLVRAGALSTNSRDNVCACSSAAARRVRSCCSVADARDAETQPLEKHIASHAATTAGEAQRFTAIRYSNRQSSVKTTSDPAS